MTQRSDFRSIFEAMTEVARGVRRSPFFVFSLVATDLLAGRPRMVSAGTVFGLTSVQPYALQMDLGLRPYAFIPIRF